MYKICFSTKSNSIWGWGSSCLHKFSLSSNYMYMSSLRTTTFGCTQCLGIMQYAPLWVVLCFVVLCQRILRCELLLWWVTFWLWIVILYKQKSSCHTKSDFSHEMPYCMKPILTWPKLTLCVLYFMCNNIHKIKCSVRKCPLLCLFHPNDIFFILIMWC